jgi:hypothetical protein
MQVMGSRASPGAMNPSPCGLLENLALRRTA